MPRPAACSTCTPGHPRGRIPRALVRLASAPSGPRPQVPLSAQNRRRSHAGRRDPSAILNVRRWQVDPEAVRDAMVRGRISRLRRLSPRPFGLAQAAPPLPVSLGSKSWKAGIASIMRAVTRSPAPFGRMSLYFGWLFDLQAPLVEVTTHWDGESWNDPDVPGHQPGAWELGAAEHRDNAIGRQDWMAMSFYDHPGPDGPFEHGQLAIAVSGQERTIPLLHYRHYQAFCFQAGKIVVTVVSRHQPAAMPRFEQVTDIEPFIAGWLAQRKERDDRGHWPTRQS